MQFLDNKVNNNLTYLLEDNNSTKPLVNLINNNNNPLPVIILNNKEDLTNLLVDSIINNNNNLVIKVVSNNLPVHLINLLNKVEDLTNLPNKVEDLTNLPNNNNRAEDSINLQPLQDILDQNHKILDKLDNSNKIIAVILALIIHSEEIIVVKVAAIYKINLINYPLLNNNNLYNSKLLKFKLVSTNLLNNNNKTNNLLKLTNLLNKDKLETQIPQKKD